MSEKPRRMTEAERKQKFREAHALVMRDYKPLFETFLVQQGIFGRLFGYGTVTVVGTGGTRE
jgi:hypothetical protein